MELNLSDTVKQIITAFILMIIPLLLILIGVILPIINAWYFIGAVTWFGVGLILFSALN
jgi:hypothetical protein